jgi:diguanylate cyclase (GGDEF)-like protein
MANTSASPFLAGGDRRRVLVAANDEARPPYLSLRTIAAERVWDVLEADCFDRTRFILQMDNCDVLLLDGSLFKPNDDAWGWLISQHHLPTLFVADAPAHVILAALRDGALQWMPRELAVREPAVLSETLYQVALVGETRRRARVATEAMQDARRQVSRLVGLLWEATPTAGGPRWFSQRHMIERLYQEVSRTERYGGPLTVVLGEMHSPARARLTAEESHDLATWTAERLSVTKRRCDVAGQYGPHGFMMILPGTTIDGAITCCKRVQEILEAADGPHPPPVPQLQVYFGIAAFSATSATVKSLLSRAEDHLEQARSRTGDGVVA